MTTLTLVGNLVADPEIRFTPNGRPVASFTVANNIRTFKKETGEWVDGESLFMRCTVWGTYAENVAQSLTKGCRVIVVGKLRQRSFETKTGEKRTVVELDVDDVGPALRAATATVARATSPAPATEVAPW